MAGAMGCLNQSIRPPSGIASGYPYGWPCLTGVLLETKSRARDLPSVCNAGSTLKSLSKPPGTRVISGSGLDSVQAGAGMPVHEALTVNDLIV
jgi:hypothetical protein